jgi:hypothetical protein
MARGILILGESGSGKTTSCRNLNPEETYYCDLDGKGLAWAGWKRQYNTEKKNYTKVAEADKLMVLMKGISEKRPEVKVIVLDTLNAIMLNMEMLQRKNNSYSQWMDLATNIYGLLEAIGSLRDDLTVVCIAHSQTEMMDNGYQFTHMKTSGRKLEKIVPESKFTTVLLAKGNDGKYCFETRAKNSTAKTPMGLYEEDEIENDIVPVIEKLKVFEEG